MHPTSLQTCGADALEADLQTYALPMTLPYWVTRTTKTLNSVGRSEALVMNLVVVHVWCRLTGCGYLNGRL